MRVDNVISKEKHDQKAIEEWTKEFWENNKIYEMVKEKSNKSNKKFYFLDGPPYANANTIHVGTLWNKVLKDAILRYYRMRGYNVWDKPGFDTHGLPIEVMIEKKLGTKNKRDIESVIGVSNFVNECLEFTNKNIESMIDDFKEMGVFMDWKHPYITYKDDYIESGWYLIKKAHEKGLLYKGKKVLHWCPRCETTLADYEVSEYRELEDPSIYVKFRIKNEKNRYLLIWTTTPWTLPANAFVMANPSIKYVVARVGEEEIILSKERLEDIMKEAGIKEYTIVSEMEGRDLENIEYVHPLEGLVPAQEKIKRYHKVVMAPEAVSSNEGTGLVHSAPGHGEIDSVIGMKIGAPLLSLVDDQGYMSEEAGKYANLYFRSDANEEIIKDLKKRNALFHYGKIKHRYPVCWRCKTPLLLKATDQWFVAVSKIKDKLIDEGEKIQWTPSWAKTRFMNIIDNVRDWVVSRQRFWGIPLPIWKCEKCNHVEVIGGVKELEKFGGKRPKNLHRPWIDDVTLTCPKCGGKMKRVKDVLDVWFDSGIAFYSSLGYPKNRDTFEKLYPVDLILEGHDQTRGWFFSTLRSGIIGFNSAPYKKVLLHGFVLDEQGREMHKSLGNYVSFEELVSKYPKDVIRFYLLQSTTWEDLKFSWKGLEQVSRYFSIIWNVFSFASMYMALDNFDPKENDIESLPLEIEDRWLISRTNSMLREYNLRYSSLEIHNAVRKVVNFIVEDVSHWYLKLIRKRVWREEDTPSKRAAYATLYYALKIWLLITMPIIPFLGEYLYQKFVRPAEPDLPLSASLIEIPDADISKIDDHLEEKMEVARRIVEGIVSARMKAGIKIRVPIKSVYISLKDKEMTPYINDVKRLVEEITNVKEITIVKQEFFEDAKIYSVEPNYKELGPIFKKDLPKVLDYIKANEREMGYSLIRGEGLKVEINGKVYPIEQKYFKINASYPDWLEVSDTDVGIVAIDKRISKEEYKEGLAREVIRRIQFMRKEMDLQVDAYINTWLAVDDDLLSEIKGLVDYIKNETRSVSLTFEDPPENAYKKEWEVGEKRIIIGIMKR